MNYIFDIIIVLCMGWGAYKGFKKGFIIQSFAVFSVAIAIWGGFTFSEKIEPVLKNNFNMDPIVCSIVSFIIIFLLVLFVVYILGKIVTKVANAATLGMLNKLAGAAFGIFVNVLVLSAIILLFNKINDNKNYVKTETMEKSFLYEPVGKVLTAVLPNSFVEKFSETKQ